MKRKLIRQAAMDSFGAIPEIGFQVIQKTGNTSDQFQLPRLEVGWGEEELSAENDQPLDGTGIYDVPLELIISQQDDCNDLQDFIDESVYYLNQKVRADPTFGNLAIDSKYVGSGIVEPSDDGQDRTIKYLISIMVTYAE